MPRLVVQTVATGGLIDQSTVPVWVSHLAASAGWAAEPSVLVLEFGNAKFETGVLLEMLTRLAKEVRHRQMILVVATDQPSVAQVVDMVAKTEELSIFVTSSANDLQHARPVGRLTLTEQDSLNLLDRLGGRVTASRFATEAALELTAAGNRLTNLARRGYVLRVPRSRRDGDEFLGLAAVYHAPLSPAANANLGSPSLHAADH
jgi:hypothetical protein